MAVIGAFRSWLFAAAEPPGYAGRSNSKLPGETPIDENQQNLPPCHSPSCLGVEFPHQRIDGSGALGHALVQSVFLDSGGSLSVQL